MVIKMMMKIDVTGTTMTMGITTTGMTTVEETTTTVGTTTMTRSKELVKSWDTTFLIAHQGSKLNHAMRR